MDGDDTVDEEERVGGDCGVVEVVVVSMRVLLAAAAATLWIDFGDIMVSQ